MKYRLSLVLLSLSAAIYAEPANLTFAKQNLVKYHDSGDYLHEFEQVIKTAKLYLAQKIKKNQSEHKKLALVLDIDETSLSNYQYMKPRDFGGTLKQFNQDIERGDAPALEPTLKLYNYAKKNHMAVFFVTGRKENQRQITSHNLKKAGYSAWDGLYLKPNDYHQKSIIPYKSKARKEIASRGYTIVESIGDQNSDIEGGYSEKGFKLPNPYYYLP